MQVGGFRDPTATLLTLVLTPAPWPLRSVSMLFMSSFARKSKWPSPYSKLTEDAEEEDREVREDEEAEEEAEEEMETSSPLEEFDKMATLALTWSPTWGENLAKSKHGRGFFSNYNNFVLSQCSLQVSYSTLKNQQKPKQKNKIMSFCLIKVGWIIIYRFTSYPAPAPPPFSPYPPFPLLIPNGQK